jgi:hypothetical protein
VHVLRSFNDNWVSNFCSNSKKMMSVS